jgi:hypothetical protein
MIVKKCFSINDRLWIVSLKEDWPSLIRDFEPHIFVDELSAIQSEESGFLKSLAKLRQNYRSGEEKCLWLSLDFQQTLIPGICQLPPVEGAML